MVDRMYEREVPGGASQLQNSTLAAVWEAVAALQTLGQIATVHRGIEYNLPFDENEGRLLSAAPRADFTPGLARADDDFEPFFVSRHEYLNTRPEVMRRQAYLLAWAKPKVLANAARKSRGWWVLAAVPDHTGLVASQRFHGIWPMSDWPIEVIAAILNGPVANAFLAERITNRDNRIQTLNQVPVPNLGIAQREEIAALVGQYRHLRGEWLANPSETPRFIERSREALLRIDAAVLTAYDLHPRTERLLLDCFTGEERPGPAQFTGYYEPGFQSALPLRMIVSGELREARADRVMARMPVFYDPVITEALADLDPANT
jgi:hypothetical protein